MTFDRCVKLLQPQIYMAALRALNFGTPDLGQVSILVRKLEIISSYTRYFNKLLYVVR